MLLFQLEEQSLDVAARFVHGNGWGNANVEKQFCFFRRAAGSPCMSATNAAQIDNGFLAAVSSLSFPGTNPFEDRFHQCVHSANRVHLLAAFAKRGVHVNSGTRDSYPHGTEMLEDNVHVGWLPEDAHVGQNAVIHEVMSAKSVSAIFFALELSPLGLFNLARHCGNDDVALQANAGTLQGFHRLGVANQGSLHVVNAKAIQESLSHHSVRLVAQSCEEVFAPG